jgi:DNA-binding NtrC family response regulator
VANRVLLVEDDPAVRSSIAETLLEEGIDVQACGSAELALTSIARAAPDVVLSDVRMPGMSGLELLKVLRERAPNVDVVLMTAFDDMPTVAQAMREGAFDFLVKPIKLTTLRNVLHRVLTDRRERRLAQSEAADSASFHVDAFVGRDPRMLQVYKRVGQIASSRINALIRGETGTGKGKVARAIHFTSAAAADPFIAVNCTSIPETLLESELFGHVRGAFTGAVSDRRGRFALAGRGTIFLDEVGDTSPEFQAKLLRVLEDREFFAVGAERPERTEARVIAATHRDLESQVRDGRFREDLYYRLRIVEIVLPTLRDRVEDIPLLAQHFVRKVSTERASTVSAISDDAMAALLQHRWPGNVRELENCITRAVVLATGNVIRAEHLELGAAMDPVEGFPTLELIEGKHVSRALALAEGNRTRAAEILGISKPRLYRLIEKHRIA